MFSIQCKPGFSQSRLAPPALDSLERVAVNILKQNLNELSGWNKVHAAEYLLWTGHTRNIQTIFLNQKRLFGREPEYRIGIWRVLIESSQDSMERKKWISKIIGAFLNTSGPDRIHAAETLAKLKTSPLKFDPLITMESLESDNSILSLYTRWSICYSSTKLLLYERIWLIKFLKSEKESIPERRLAAYIISNLGDLSEKEWTALSDIALKESPGSGAKVYLLSAAYVTAPKSAKRSEEYHKIEMELFTIGSTSDRAGRVEMAIVLAKRGTPNDIVVLTSLLNTRYPLLVKSDNQDVQSAACYGILAIINKLVNE